MTSAVTSIGIQGAYSPLHLLVSDDSNNIKGDPSIKSQFVTGLDGLKFLLVERARNLEEFELSDNNDGIVNLTRDEVAEGLRALESSVWTGVYDRNFMGVFFTQLDKIFMFAKELRFSNEPSDNFSQLKQSITRFLGDALNEFSDDTGLTNLIKLAAKRWGLVLPKPSADQ